MPNRTAAECGTPSVNTRLINIRKQTVAQRAAAPITRSGQQLGHVVSHAAFVYILTGRMKNESFSDEKLPVSLLSSLSILLNLMAHCCTLCYVVFQKQDLKRVFGVAWTEESK